LVPPPLRDLGGPYLVHRLAIYNRLRQSELVADYTCHNSLAVLSGPGTDVTSQERVPQSSYQEEKVTAAAGFEPAPKGLFISNKPKAY